MELDAIRSEFEVFSPPKDGIYFGEREPRYFYNSNNQREDCNDQNARWQTWQHRQQELDALQAKLDAVMLEYCPDEMTQEQTEKWASIQVVSDNSELDAARLDNQKLREFIEYWSHDSRLMTFESRQVFRSGAEQLLASETFTQALAAQQEKE